VTLARRIPIALIVGGAATIAAALLWWTLSYWQVWSNDYLSVAEASRCLVADSSICRLATSLCTGRHVGFIAIYSPVALWAGVALAFCGLLPVRRSPTS
jgi:hypothetical protein